MGERQRGTERQGKKIGRKKKIGKELGARERDLKVNIKLQQA